MGFPVENVSISFNPDPIKQAKGVIFTRKVKKVVHQPIFFNEKQVRFITKPLGSYIKHMLNV